MRYFLGVDVGGSKTHALIADESGQALGFAQAGPGNWEAVGYDGLTEVLQNVITKARIMGGVRLDEITNAGIGLAGFDWPDQEHDHRKAIEPLGFAVPPVIVNDTILGIIAGSEDGWGISIVSGTGCNCRGWNKEQNEGRVVGGAGLWSGEAAGGTDILARAMRAVVYEWTKRGSETSLSSSFLKHTGAENLSAFIEGAYLGRYSFDPSMLMLVFKAAHNADPEALDVMRWAGKELAGMASGVIKQLDLQDDPFDIVLIGSIYDGHPLILKTLQKEIIKFAPGARLVRLEVPPVTGAVLLGMQNTGIDIKSKRKLLMATTETLIRNCSQRTSLP